ncbi:EAL domain-containing protein [Amorphus sp. MBR-141]|jgi:EAL domain-containing protein (putative c-di-GMP-specific phosphodiesterase class I)/GGDEF domain-containing protein
MAIYSSHFDVGTLPGPELWENVASRFKAASSRGKTVCIIIHLNCYYEISVLHGVNAAEAVINAAESRLMAMLGKQYFVGRVGIEQFLIYVSIENGNLFQTKEVEGWLSRIELDVSNVGGGVHVDCMYGISEDIDESSDLQELLKSAVLALRGAKSSRRRVARLIPSSIWSMGHFLWKKSEYESAMKNNEFELHFQAQVDILTNKIVCAEGLLRWNHPQLGLLPPGDFLPNLNAIDDGDLSLRLGEWVVSKSIDELVRFRRKENLFKVSVNLSPRQLEDRAHIEKIVGLIAKSGLFDSVELEVSENALLTNDPGIVGSLKYISDSGITLSLDDFGTGFVSLASLKLCEFKKIKIDRSFVSGIESDSVNRSIIRSIISLGRGLSADVVAEGVENYKQLCFLRSEGCRYTQGFYHTKPMPAEGFNWILSRNNEESLSLAWQ